MKIDILFPVFENSNDFFSTYFSSNFAKTTNATYYFYVKEGATLDFLKKVPTTSSYEIRKAQKNFNINDAFLDYLSLNSSCDILLLGDTKVSNLGKLFEKCIEKNKDGANIVHIKKRYGKFKGFFANLKEKFINLFLSIYTGKKDKFNVPTLGLIDKNLLDILRTLPHKACFLKNTNDFYGYDGRTIFVQDSIKPYKESFRTMTSSLKTIFVFLGLNLISIAGVVLGAVFSKRLLMSLSIFAVLGSLAGITLLIPKHFLDIRTKKQGATFETVTLEKKKEVTQRKEKQATAQKIGGQKKGIIKHFQQKN